MQKNTIEMVSVAKMPPHHLLIKIDDGVFLCLHVKNRYIPMIILIL